MYNYFGIDYRVYLIAAAVSIAVYVFIWLIFRRPTLWYFRINEMIALQERTVAALEKLAEIEHRKHPEKSPVRPLNAGWVCMKCGTMNKWYAEECSLCHAKKSEYGQ